MGSIITEEQSAYLSNRNILDGPLMLNETIAWLRKTKKCGFFFKIDFEKAFDSLSWEFLDSIMEQMGFPKLWSDWINAILKSARASVLINGSPTREFTCFRGLRQGDPLSPFLFIIAMEAFSCFIKKSVLEGLFCGIKTPNANLSLTHFLFADDAIILGEWLESNVDNLMRILRCFYLVSGLKPLLWFDCVNDELIYSVNGTVSAKKSSDVTELQIGVKHKPISCEVQAHKGDRIKVHYRGKLTDGTVFDSSFERGDPIEFELGTGQVIIGWDQGLLGMCVGEKRKLKIPAKMGYGDEGSPPTIPGGATLIFDTELVAVNGKGTGAEETHNSEL
ncbi:hypothetical protein E3N88_41595 [Mikania micrantha]|uniref:peptidylprolyl isomerase n=1 Tax=Mikania micrantha TaxID=192012 RepID=A0A5N6LMF9_9ASTR|nr:hypothetical protein E3N88_41595 [Mikania micrantha]